MKRFRNNDYYCQAKTPSLNLAESRPIASKEPLPIICCFLSTSRFSLSSSLRRKYDSSGSPFYPSSAFGVSPRLLPYFWFALLYFFAISLFLASISTRRLLRSNFMQLIFIYGNNCCITRLCIKIQGSDCTNRACRFALLSMR